MRASIIGRTAFVTPTTKKEKNNGGKKQEKTKIDANLFSAIRSSPSTPLLPAATYASRTVHESHRLLLRNAHSIVRNSCAVFALAGQNAVYRRFVFGAGWRRSGRPLAENASNQHHHHYRHKLLELDKWEGGGTATNSAAGGQAIEGNGRRIGGGGGGGIRLSLTLIHEALSEDGGGGGGGLGLVLRFFVKLGRAYRQGQKSCSRLERVERADPPPILFTNTRCEKSCRTLTYQRFLREKKHQQHDTAGGSRQLYTTRPPEQHAKSGAVINSHIT